jgi:hypothetical protein
VIVSSQTGPGSIIVTEIRDDSQLTLLTAIAIFGDSTPPFFVSKNKIFQENLLAGLEMSEGHDKNSGPKTLMTEVLFIPWLQTVFLPWSKRSGRGCTKTIQLYFLSKDTLPTSLPE